MEKEVSKNRLYEVSASKIPSTKFCEGFWNFVAVSSTTGPPFHELSTIALGSTKNRCLQNPFCALPLRLPLNLWWASLFSRLSDTSTFF